jgi:hypothetical protein
MEVKTESQKRCLEVKATMDKDKNVKFVPEIEDKSDENGIKDLILSYFRNFVNSNNEHETEIIYPSVFRRKYYVRVTYEKNLWDVKMVDELRKYSKDLKDNGWAKMSEAVEKYIGSREELCKSQIISYVLFNPDFNDYEIGDIASIKGTHTVAMKIGEEYPVFSRIYHIHASGRYYEFNVSGNQQDRIVSDIYLKKVDDGYFVISNVLIDTGAPISSFDYRLLVDIGYDSSMLPDSTVNGAGSADAKLVSILEVSFFGIRISLTNVKFFNLAKDPERFNGLIGMDILQYVKFTLDGNNVYI